MRRIVLEPAGQDEWAVLMAAVRRIDATAQDQRYLTQPGAHCDRAVIVNGTLRDEP